MLDWITQNSDTLQVFLNGMMVVIWVAYLQIFLVSFRRQQRSDILINMGSGTGLNARCFISNLSLEPLYLNAVLIELTTKDGVHEAGITDQARMTEKQHTSKATNQGPLKSGDSIDIGSFNDLLERASPELEGVDFDSITHVQVTAVAKTSSRPEIVGAYRKYQLRKSDSQTDVIPMQVNAEQIRSWLGRWKLRRKMDRRLEER